MTTYATDDLSVVNSYDLNNQQTNCATTKRLLCKPASHSKPQALGAATFHKPTILFNVRYPLSSCRTDHIRRRDAGDPVRPVPRFAALGDKGALHVK